jgi:hypothetical protein
MTHRVDPMKPHALPRVYEAAIDEAPVSTREFVRDYMLANYAFDQLFERLFCETQSKLAITARLVPR